MSWRKRLMKLYENRTTAWVDYNTMKKFIAQELKRERKEMRDEILCAAQSIFDDSWMMAERKLKDVIDNYLKVKGS